MLNFLKVFLLVYRTSILCRFFCNVITRKGSVHVGFEDIRKTETIQLRVTKEQKKIIKELCNKKKMTQTDFILYALMKVITEEE